MPARVPLRTIPLLLAGGNQVGTETFIEVDTERLFRELRQSIGGQVRFDPGTRAMYARDASIYRQVPIGVVMPLDPADVESAVAIAREHGAPIVARGAGTSIPGQASNVALAIDFSRHMNRLLEIDPSSRTARVEPGITKDGLDCIAAPHDLMFGPDPATHATCTIGGMIGNDSGGAHSLIAGRTSQNLESLEVLLYDGTRMRVGETTDEAFKAITSRGGRCASLYANLATIRDRYADLIRSRYPKVPRRVSGYALDCLLPEHGFHIARALAASEGTCAITLEAIVRLVPRPRARALLVLGFPTIADAGDMVPLALDARPIAVEGMEYGILEGMRAKGIAHPRPDLLPDGKAWLLVEFGGDTYEQALEGAKSLLGRIQRGVSSLLVPPEEQRFVWHVREQGLGATAFVPGKPLNYEGWEDTAVAPDKLGGYLRDFRKLIESHGYESTFYGHFGDGVVHTRVNFDLSTDEGISRFRAFVQDGADLVTTYGGTFSAEHGDGQARGELLAREFGPELVNAFAEYKKAWDPDWRLNPGKVIAPDPLDARIAEPKCQVRNAAAERKTHFKYPSDGNSFEMAANRCVGAGLCRKRDAGAMCPSYMATGEEKHCTRGRARVLSEMLRGEVVADGWRSREVKDALDLCLACKACKRECPVRVDMATYKAEFMAHYYSGRLRPINAYAFGLMPIWARYASHAPWLANLMMRPPLDKAAKWMMGADSRRSLPSFARASFRKVLRKREVAKTGSRRVVLWPDTFTNYFNPHIALAAVAVLEAAGFEVAIPKKTLCCGRPLYDYGMLRTAKKWLLDVIRAMEDEIVAGTPVVALEPGCASVFRDEMLNLLPDHEGATKLSEQVVLLSEFLVLHAPHFVPPRLHRKALVHGHCHHKSLMRMDDTVKILDAMGLDYELVDSGCCGMAGAFGFERGEHYEVSMKCGERVLLPAVRSAANDTLIMADGFSCREQVLQATGRAPLHLAEVIALGLSDREASV